MGDGRGRVEGGTSAAGTGRGIEGLRGGMRIVGRAGRVLEDV